MKVLLLFILLLPLTINAQSYLMNGNPITDCSGTFYDSGGPAGNYGNNQNLITTLCSDGVSGTHVRLSFSGTNLAPGDVLCFYDGPSAASPLLACSTDYPSGQQFVIQASATNPSGCITVTFQSNSSGTATGWAAAISCVASCQAIIADLVSTTPASVPADTGWIDICPGERVFFKGIGIYPQNNFAYAQSDFTTNFEWNFGDGAIAYGPNTSHRFETPGGYFVQFQLTDTLGCRSGNLISQRIRVSHRPEFNMAAVSQICAGDTLHLSATVDSSKMGTTLSVTPISVSFDLEASRADSLPLPDGTGELYQTSILLTEFSPGQIMTSANDLESICVDMEHSWMRDIQITLTCPSGQSIILHDHPGNFGGEVYLGVPNDNDNFNPVPGLGYEYCWTPNASNPTWIVYANTILGGTGTLPAGDYSSFNPMSDLIGCPLNGDWTIGVTDLWPADNGFIFNWSIKFQEKLYPNIETFTPQFLSWNWSNNPSIFFSTADSIAAAPQNAGTAGYTFSVHDEFGCTWDTLVSVSVLPPTHPNCYECVTNFRVLVDTNVCAGQPVELNATSLAPAQKEVRFEAYPDYRLGNANHPHSNPYLSPIGVNSLGFNFLAVPIQQITSVCMDIETDFDSDLNIFLQAPGGQKLMLSTGNGGAGDNYKITCFSPTASVPIVGQSAPFNGTYIPEGSWNVLSGAQIDGDWSLVVSDGFAPAQFGKVKWWSIGFNAQNTVGYNWSNSSTLSCPNCPTPTATPMATTSYVVTAMDNHHCIHTDTATINVTTFFPAPTGLIVFQLGVGTMTWAWDAVPSALGYELSVNSGPWQSPNNGLLSHVVSGVNVGDTVNITLRCISPTACVPAELNASSIYPVCTMFGGVFSTTDVMCAGDTTGSVTLSVSNATSPVLFFLDSNPVPFPNGDLLNILSAGSHSVIILDALGCRDTVVFTINAPAPISINASGTNVLCNGDNSGSVLATATGGTGGLAFAWQDCLGGAIYGGPSQNNLFAGCYGVTVTDGKGCTNTSSVTLTEPAPYNFMATQDSVSCMGGQDGGASIAVTGGAMPYTYLWDNGSTTATVTGLDAAFHFVTVTDANLCSATTFVEVLEPPKFLLNGTQFQFVTCFGGNNGTATVITSGGTLPYHYQWDDPLAQTTKKAVMLSAVNYNVTVTDWNGCSVQTTVMVKSLPDLVVSYSNVSGEICAGDCMGQATVIPSGGGGGYLFDWQDNAIPDLQTATNLCAGTYSVIVVDVYGCADTSQVTIGAALPILAQFNSLPPTCSGSQNGSITAQISGGTAPFQFQWSNGSTAADLLNLPCGAYFLTLTDAIGCIKNYNFLLDCPPLISLQSVVPQAVQCFGQANGSVTVTVQGGTPPLQYVWNDPAAQTTAIAQNLSAGIYTVTVSDAMGCSITSAATVLQPSQLSVSTTVKHVSCLNANDGMATAVTAGGVPPYTYNWGFPGNTQTIVNLTAGTYIVTVTDADLCTATANTTITQPGTPVMVTATQTRRACFGESDGEASVSASGSNGAPFNFSWSNGQMGGGASGLATGLYTVTATDPKGCTGTQVVSIQELDTFELKIAYAPPTCAGDANGVVGLVLVQGGLGMGDSTQYNYQWSLPGAPNEPLVSGFSAGKYTLTVTDFQGCQGILNFEVVQPTPIIIQTTAQSASCFGFSDGTAAVSAVQNAVGSVQYQWNNNQVTQQIDSLSPGIYQVTATDSNGCRAIAMAIVQQPEPLILNFQSQPLICAGDSNASIIVTVTGGTADYQYQWSKGDTTEKIQQIGAGNYSLTVTDGHACVIIDTVEVPSPMGMSLAIETVKPTCFGGQDGRIKVFLSGGEMPYRYNLNGGPFGGSSVFIALRAGDYQIQVIDANGCIVESGSKLDQPLPIQVSVGIDTTLILGQSILLSPTVNNAVGLTHFEWSSALVDSLMCVDLPDCEEIRVKPVVSNTYRIKVTDENGCMGKDEVRVNVDKPRGVYVPTGFTPNGDFENDLLVVHGKSQQVSNVLVFKVFDRWGELLYADENFKVNDTSRGWDGSFRNQPCDPGVYVWLLEAEYQDGYRELLKGDVTLIR